MDFIFLQGSLYGINGDATLHRSDVGCVEKRTGKGCPRLVHGAGDSHTRGGVLRWKDQYHALWLLLLLHAATLIWDRHGCHLPEAQRYQ